MTAILKYEQRTHNMQFENMMYWVNQGVKMCVCVDYMTCESGCEAGTFETELHLTFVDQSEVKNIENGNYIKFTGESKKEFFDKIFSKAYANMRKVYPSIKIDNIKSEMIETITFNN